MALQMKKIWLSSLAVVGLGLGFAAAVPALAAGSSSSSGSSSPSATLTTKDSQATTVFTTTNPSLTLSKVPNIDFGSNATPNGSTDLSVQAAKVDSDLEVANDGIASGWNVQVMNSAFTDSAANNSLYGAKLSFAAAGVAPANADNASPKPAMSAVSLSGDGQNQLVLSAPVKGGLGIWDTEYALSDFKLSVPAGQLPGSYVSNLTWQLSNAPQ